MNSLELTPRRFNRLKRQLVFQQKEQRRVERQLKIKSLYLKRSEEQRQLLTDTVNQQVESNLEQGQQTESQYRQLIDSAQDIIFKISPEGYFTFANSMTENCLGYTQAELIGRHFVHFILPDYRTELIRFYQTMLQTGQSTTYSEFPVRAKDGHTVWIGQTVGLVKDEQQGSELVAIARDITQKYQSDERIRKSEEKYRTIMDTMELGLLEVDNDQTILRAYERFCNMLGYTQDELLGKNAADLLVQAEFKEVVDRQQNARQQGNAGSYELALTRKDGSRIWVLVSGVPIFDEHGVLVGSMGIHYDLTERKRLEDELANARQIAEEARHTEKQFLANMSHEIRTPLNAILGFSNLLESTPLDIEQKEFASFIRTAGKNLLNIVNDILDISKIEAGMLPLESIPFSIPSLADSIRTMLHSAATDKNLWLIVETDPTLPPVVLGDPTRLTQILVNLLNNAIKFTQQGGVRVRIEKRAVTADSIQVRFSVQDTGIGMAADILPFIFERFRQASDFTTRYYGGTGLGLNIVKSLAEMQGGSVNVTSTLGEGSCFTLEIPYRIASTSIDQITERSAITLNPELSNLRILIVEDNLMNQKLALQVLKRLGYSAQLAENGQLALDSLQKNDFDLVLMDIQMPVMDGYTATRHVRNTLRKDVPIIAMTAHALASEREQCLQAGMNDFLPKPFQVEELQRILRKYTPYSESPSSNKPKEPEPVKLKPSFSVEVLLAALDDDREFAAEVMELFLAQTPGEIEQIRQALEQTDLSIIGGIIHAQKVAFQMFGLTEMVRLSQMIAVRITDKQPITEVTPLVNQFLRTLEAELPVIQFVLQTDFHL